MLSWEIDRLWCYRMAVYGITIPDRVAVIGNRDSIGQKGRCREVRLVTRVSHF